MILFVLFLLAIAGPYYCFGKENTFLARSLGSHMILQRDTTTFVFGFSKSPETTINAEFNSNIYSAISNREAAVDGGYFWKIGLPPTAAGFTPFSINISASSGESALLLDVVFGDVFLCSGQSNMQFGIPDMYNGTAEVADADRFPNIRLFSVFQDYCMPQAEEPFDDVYTVSLPWSQGSSQALKNSYFSAVCWMFGKNVYENVVHRAYPVGLVHSSWGGTIIQAWGPTNMTDACSASSPGSNDVVIDPLPKKVNDCAFDPNRVASLYNTMIMPLKDLQFRAAVWYQGESNTGPAPSQYACLQDKLVSEWRKLWGDDFGFIYTQLSTWTAGGGYVVPDFRNMQAMLTFQTKNIAMITAADIGDPESPYGDIHPRNKTEVGRRMSLAASSLLYGVSVPHMGPIVESAQSFKSDFGAHGVRITFNKASCGEAGLYLQDPQICPEASQKQKGGCGPVLLKYFPNRKEKAEIALDGPNAIVITPVNRALFDIDPTGVSYGQGDYPIMNVYNAVGAPLIPFEIVVSN